MVGLGWGGSLWREVNGLPVINGGGAQKDKSSF